MVCHAGNFSINTFIPAIIDSINPSLISFASGVVAGVALESHLRKLAEKNSIPIITDEWKYINADSLNGELRKKGILDKTLNKSITSWLGLRNDAAHPDAKEINEGLIESMIAGIKVFIEKFPA